MKPSTMQCTFAWLRVADVKAKRITQRGMRTTEKAKMVSNCTMMVTGGNRRCQETQSWHVVIMESLALKGARSFNDLFIYVPL